MIAAVVGLLGEGAGVRSGARPSGVWVGDVPPVPVGRDQPSGGPPSADPGSVPGGQSAEPQLALSADVAVQDGVGAVLDQLVPLAQGGAASAGRSSPRWRRAAARRPGGAAAGRSLAGGCGGVGADRVGKPGGGERAAGLQWCGQPRQHGGYVDACRVGAADGGDELVEVLSSRSALIAGVSPSTVRSRSAGGEIVGVGGDGFGFARVGRWTRRGPARPGWSRARRTAR